MRHRFLRVTSLLAATLAGLNFTSAAWAQASGSDVRAVGDRSLGVERTRLIQNPTLVTLNLANVDVRQILETMGRKGGMNLLIDDSVQGKVTISLKAVPLEEALNLVMKMQDLEARRVGSTLLIATRAVFSKKKFTGMQTVLFRIDNSKVTDLEPKIKQALAMGDEKAGNETIRILSDERTNSLIMTASEDTLDRAKALIQALDIPTPQVLIEVRMIEVSTRVSEQLGLNYGFGGSKFGAGFNNSNPNTTAGGVGNQAGNPATSSGGTALTFNALGNFTANFNARLDAAIQNNNATVLANPRVAAQDNKKATIQIVNKFPVTNVTITPNGFATTQVTFQEAGQILNITPRIDTKGFVTLELAPEISAKTGDVIVNGNAVPIIDSRKVETTMRVKDGESIVIGGLKRTDVTKSVVKVPLLGDIPLLGRFFQTTVDSKSESEIIIVVTPKITTRLAGSQELLPGAGDN
ncbi:MAG: secretin N-terminal domain-containing protein [Candidatus Sericytochromatia bacterium]|nr:secretin N-terminal domain-containing protein [Candidatus Sericytochromatia bacterium]